MSQSQQQASHAKMMHHRNSISQQQQQQLQMQQQIQQQQAQQMAFHHHQQAQGAAQQRYPIQHIQTSLPPNVHPQQPQQQQISASSPSGTGAHPHPMMVQHHHHSHPHQAHHYSQVYAAPQQPVAVSMNPATQQAMRSSAQQQQPASQPKFSVPVQKPTTATTIPSAGSNVSSAPLNPPSVPMPSSLNRLSELFDHLRAEIENLAKEASMYKAQKEELETRLTQQLHEMQAFQTTIFDFEKAHIRMKQSFEEEVLRLRRELEVRNIPIPSTTSAPVGGQNTSVPAASSPKSSQHQYPGLHQRHPGPQKSPVDTQQPLMRPIPSGTSSKPPTPSLVPHPLPGQLQQLQQHATVAPGYPQQGVPTGYPHQQQALQQSVKTLEHDAGIPAQRQPSNPLKQSPPSQPQLPVRIPTPVSGPADTFQHSVDPSVAGRPMSTLAVQNQHHQVSLPSSASSVSVPSVTPNPTGLRTGVDTAIIDAEKKRTARDWIAIYNPKHPSSSSLKLSLLHSLEHSSVIWCVKFSQDGKLLATGSNHVTRIYDALSGALICELIDTTISKEELYIRSVCFSPDSSKIVTGSSDVDIRIWDVSSGRIVQKLHGHEQEIYSVDWSMDGKLIASGSADLTCRLWDPNTGTCINTMQEKDAYVSVEDMAGSEAGIASVAIRPKDGKCVAAGYFDKSIRIWDAMTGQLLQRFEGHTNLVFSVSFSTDGNSVVSGSLDCHIHVWDLSKTVLQYLDHIRNASAGENIIPPRTITSHSWRHAFLGHEKYVLSVAYPGFKSSLGSVNENGDRALNPRGKEAEIDWIISGSKDHTVTFWDTRQAGPQHPESAPVLTLRGHDSSIISIASSPTGGVFATGSGDMKTRIWRLSHNSNAPLIPTSSVLTLPPVTATPVSMHNSIPTAQPVPNTLSEPRSVFPPSSDNTDKVNAGELEEGEHSDDLEDATHQDTGLEEGEEEEIIEDGGTVLPTRSTTPSNS